MSVFAKLFHYEEGQLLVTNDFDAVRDFPSINFRTENDLVVDQRLRFNPGTTAAEVKVVFDDFTEPKARKMFERLQRIGNAEANDDDLITVGI